MKSFRKFLESYEPVNEAEYNAEWWDSKSDNFKKRYIERHPNSIYAQKARSKPSVDTTAKSNTNTTPTPKKKENGDFSIKNAEDYSPEEIKNYKNGDHLKDVEAFDKYTKRIKSLKDPKELDKYVEKALELKNTYFVAETLYQIMENKHTDLKTIRKIGQIAVSLSNNSRFARSNELFYDDVQDGLGHTPYNNLVDLLYSISVCERLPKSERAYYERIKNSVKLARTKSETEEKERKKQTLGKAISSIKRKYGEKYNDIEAFVKEYDDKAYNRAAREFAYSYIPDEGETYEDLMDEFDGEYDINYDDLANKIKRKLKVDVDKDELEYLILKAQLRR